MSPGELEVLKIIASGLVGVVGALLGQFVSGYYASKRHREELAARDQERRSQLLKPVADRRLNAYEKSYDILQEAIENADLSLEQYILIRRQLIYLPSLLRPSILDALSSLIVSTRKRDEESKNKAIEAIRACQRSLSETLGLDVVDSEIQLLLESTRARESHNA